jgi:hypothetical protein
MAREQIIKRNRDTQTSQYNDKRLEKRGCKLKQELKKGEL